MVKLELIKHDETLLLCFKLLSFTICAIDFIDSQLGEILGFLAVSFSLIRNCVSDHNIERKLSYWDLDAWDNVENIELIRLGTFLSNWKYLEPSKTLDFIKNVSEISPIYFRKRHFVINF